MELEHISPADFGAIEEGGIFGGIFAAATVLGHTHIVRPANPLTDFELNYQIEDAYEIALEIADMDEALADAIMSAECVHESVDGWEVQRMRGELARKLGYDAVEMADEYGTSWLCLPGCPIEKRVDA